MKKGLSVILLVCLFVAGIALSYAQESDGDRVILAFKDEAGNVYWIDTSACFETPDECTANAVDMSQLEAGADVFAFIPSEDGSQLYLWAFSSDWSELDYALDLASGSVTAVSSEAAPEREYIYAPDGDQKYWTDLDQNYNMLVNIGDEIVITEGVYTFRNFRDFHWSPDSTRLGTTLVHPEQVVDTGSITILSGAPVECISNFTSPDCEEYMVYGESASVCNSVGIIDVVTGEISEITSSEDDICLSFLGWLGPDQIALGKSTGEEGTLKDIYAADTQGNVLEGASPDYLNVDTFLSMEYGVILAAADDQTVLYSLADGTSAVIASMPAAPDGIFYWNVIP